MSDRQGPEHRYGTNVPVSASSVRLRIDGCVSRPTADASAGLAGTVDGPRVGLIDLLSHVRLQPDAEVLAVEGPDGERLVIPVASALRGGTVLVHDDGVRLDVPGWTPPGRPIRLVAIRALTFREFLGCR